jgi:formate dehydrogenase accessory protein FdhE
MKDGKWDARIRRAQELAAVYPFASEGLRFYERVTGFQRSLYSDIRTACGSVKRIAASGSLRQELDLFVLLPRFGSFLSFVEANAPGPLAQSAAELRHQATARGQEVICGFWRAGPDRPSALSASDELLAWTFLQPYAQYLADHTEPLTPAGTPPLCPLCSGKPQVGVLRQEGDGAKRTLICALCSTEWDYRRLVCPACGEENVEKLAVYNAEEFSHVRVEACDTCRYYIKTVNLTKDGRAVPVVDELATIPLNLWATEHGYVKLRTNLLGI